MGNGTIFPKNMPALFRPSDMEGRGIPRGRLRVLLKKGAVERLARGLYRLTSVEPNEMETVAMVAAAVPGGIVCLLSALQMQEIGTQLPHEIWIALDRKARRPHQLPAKVRIVRFSGPMLTRGVKKKNILGVPVRFTDPARTVVDCFRYRSKIGLDVALEALRDVLRSRKATVDDIMRTAEACRARTLVRHYLEALLS